MQWTDGMSSRMRLFIDNFRDDFTGMVTLTYPEVYPSDGKTVKAHLKAFNERVRRQGWFGLGSYVWFLEFQERGAPHFHLLMSHWMGKEFIAQAWAEITGGSKEACSRVEALRSPESAGAYARKYAIKSEQKTVPTEFMNIGRMWGCVGSRHNLDGVPRVPHVEASTGVSLGKLMQAVKLENSRVRVSEHELGFTIYGTPQEITRLWDYLAVVGRFADRSGTSCEQSMRELSDVLLD